MSLCRSCGEKYDDKFKFCPNCGKVNNTNSNSSDDELEWELCEIQITFKKADGFNPLGLQNVLFEAIAIGPSGRYSADLSEPLVRFSSFKLAGTLWDWSFDDNGDVEFGNGAQGKLTIFVNKLIKEGWQPLGRGTEWYSEKFRRKVKK